MTSTARAPRRAPSELGRRLRELREGAGISARALGALAGLRASCHVGMVERGDVLEPSISILIPLARALGCSLDWLLAGQGERPSAESVRAALAAARASCPVDASTVSSIQDGAP